LATPAGVDASEGLVASFVKGAGVVGVVPSSRLGFSPVVLAGGFGALVGSEALPGPLAPFPGALAAAPTSRLLALLGGAGSPLVSSRDGAASTQTLAGLATLAQEARGNCDLVSLTAVTYGPLLRPVAGGRCLASGRLGIFQLAAAGWELIGPVVPSAAVLGAVPPGASRSGIAGAAASEAVDTQVVRLWSDGSELVALALAVSPGGTTSLFRETRVASAAWEASSVFDVPPTEHLVATGTGSAGAAFVLLSGSGGLTALLLGSSSATWKELPAPPAGTATLALGAGGAGGTEALVVRNWTLDVYALRPAGSWAKVQEITVPVP
jgi:hypothetical protein